MESDGYPASGKVSVGMGINTGKVLTSNDIDVDKILDGYHYLTRNGDWMHGVELGMLKQFTGDITIDIPDGVNPEDGDSLTILCHVPPGASPTAR